MAVQSVEEGGPSWDTSSVVDAGTRDTPIVTRASFQDASMAGVESSTTSRSFQEALEAQVTPNESAWSRGTGSADTDRYAGAVLGAVESRTTGSDIYDSVDKNIDKIANSPDAGADIYSAVSEQTSESVKRQLEAVSSNKDTAVMLGVFEELKKWKLDNELPWGFEAFSEEQLNGLAAIKSKGASQIAKERVYLKYGSAMVAREWDKHGKLDTAYDFAKLWVLPGTTLAMGNFTEKFNPSLVGTGVNALDEVVGKITDLSVDGKGFKAYKEVLDKFWKMPVEKRLVSLNAVEKHIREIAGSNSFVYMSMMQPFVEHSDVKGVELDYLMDNLTIASLIPGRAAYKVLKFATQVRDARKPIQILKDTGNLADAAKILNKALVDTPAKSIKVTGMHKAELAASTQPVDFGSIMPSQIQGVARDAAEQLGSEIQAAQRRIDDAFANMVDPSQTPKRFYFDETAKTARQQEVLQQVGSNSVYPAYARIAQHTDNGFVVEVEYGSKFSATHDAESLRGANTIHEQNIADLHEQADAIRSSKSDRAFGEDEDVLKIQDQLRASKEAIKRNNKIIKDLEKPARIETIPVKYTFNEAGALQVEELQRGTFPKIASPTQVVDQLHKQVGDATMAEFQETKLLGNLHNAVRDVIRGSTSKQRDNVDKILLWGDEQGRVFGVDELLTGVDTKWGRIKLDSTKDVSMYYGVRRAFDNIHRVKNYVKKRELELGGFKQLTSKILNSKGERVKLYAKGQRSDVTSAVGRIGVPDGVKRIYDHQTGSIVDVTDEVTKKLGKDWEVVQFRHGYRFGDEVINYGIVRPTKDFKPIDGRVLDYIPGYVPKQRPSVFYTATRKTDMLVDGVKAPRYMTERFFRTEQEGYAYWGSLSAEERANVQILPDKRYKHSAFENHDEEFDALNFGGMFTGERTDRSILMGLDGEEAHRTSSYKALSLYMGHVANRYSTNELKMNLIARFQNTYGDYLQNPANWKSDLKVQYHNDLSLRRAVDAQREYINDLIRMPDSFQNWWNQKMRSIAELMEGTPLDGKARDWVMNTGARDPTAALRTATFHVYLGAFNMSQALVQGMGFATALSAYPLKAAKLLPKNLALGAAWSMRHNKKAMVDWFHAVGLDGDDMADIVHEIERVGLFDSLKTSADYNAGIHGISVTSDAARRVMEAGLIPFRAGEGFSRGYGYLLARDLFLSSRKKGYKITEKDMDFIAKDSLRFTLNLNRSNKAWWQQGILSIPTQFLQVQVKFWENMIAGSFDRGLRSKIPEINVKGHKFFGGEKTSGYGNRVWTTGEKVKILLGSMAMFGVAGVPWLDNAVATGVQMYREATNDTQAMTTDRINVFNGVAGLDDASVARAYKGGLVQMMAYWLTGADPELTTRFSIASGVEESIDMYTHGDRTLLQAMVGAMGPGLGRTFDAIVGLGRIFNPAYSDDISDDQVKMAMREVASVMSSTRNAEKAYWWHKMGAITNAKGQKIVEMEDEEFGSTLLWQALGFAPAKVGWMYDDKESKAELEQRITKATKDINTMLDKYYIESDLRGSEQKEKFLNKFVSLRLEGYTKQEKDKVMRGIKTHLVDNDQRLIKAVADSIKATADAGGRTTQGNFANPLHVPEKE